MAAAATWPASCGTRSTAPRIRTCTRASAEFSAYCQATFGEPYTAAAHAARGESTRRTRGGGDSPCTRST